MTRPLLALLCVVAPSIALAGDGEPSTAMLTGYALAAAAAITPLAIILINLGRKTGKYETTQEQHAADLTRLQRQHDEAECSRRNDMALVLTENRVTRESVRDALDKLTDKLSAQMVPRETAILQIANLESKLKADILRELLKEVIAAIRATPGDHVTP